MGKNVDRKIKASFTFLFATSPLSIKAIIIKSQNNDKNLFYGTKHE